MKNIKIAIDGASSTGKSTLAKRLATHFSYVYVDSGAMYRAITHYALEHHWIGTGFFYKEQLIEALDDIALVFSENSGLLLNNSPIEPFIRTLNVSDYVSQVATVSEVRRFLVNQQRIIGQNGGVVMDGRDIGTVVFPTAELKLYLTASLRLRAKRRHQELLSRGEKVSYEAVLDNIEKRDTMDQNRNDSPLQKAKDAVLLCTDSWSVNKLLDKVITLAKKQMKP